MKTCQNTRIFIDNTNLQQSCTILLKMSLWDKNVSLKDVQVNFIYIYIYNTNIERHKDSVLSHGRIALTKFK